MLAVPTMVTEPTPTFAIISGNSRQYPPDGGTKDLVEIKDAQSEISERGQQEAHDDNGLPFP